MQLGHTLEESAVAGHRIIGAGEDHNTAVERIEDRKDHRRADNQAAGVAEQPVSGLSAEIIVARIDHRNDGVIGQHPVDRVVEQNVEHRDANDRDDDGQRQVLFGMLDFLGNTVQVGPALISPHRSHNTEGDHAENLEQTELFFSSFCQKTVAVDQKNHRESRKSAAS